MGNVLAAGAPQMPAPPMGAPPPPGMGQGQSPAPPQPAPQTPPTPPEETGPGTFEDLHKKCKGL